jgi:hypothetical protein
VVLYKVLIRASPPRRRGARVVADPDKRWISRRRGKAGRCRQCCTSAARRQGRLAAAADLAEKSRFFEDQPPDRAALRAPPIRPFRRMRYSMSLRPRKILVLTRFLKGSANTISDFLFSFNGYSQHEVFYWTRFHTLTPAQLADFDAIVLFWSFDWLRPRLPAHTIEAIANARATKILFLQDEYRSVYLARAAINRFRVNMLFSNVDREDREAFYPQSELPTLRHFESILTGYAPANLQQLEIPDRKSRPIDVAYRSRTCSYYLGDLAQEKTRIAEGFLHAAQAHGLKNDISVWEGDRIYGQAYIDFLKRSRTVLGTESGASVVDFDGQIQQKCEDYLAKNPQASYEEVKRRFFADVDGKIYCRGISPRIFESTSLGNTLVLHEGRYNDILRPGEHYIAIKKDHSNLADVIEQIKDRDHCERIAVRAHEDLIASGRYSYQQFVGRFDRLIEEHVEPARVPVRRSKVAFYTQSFFQRGQGVIPRGDSYARVPNVDWVEGSLRRGVNRFGLAVLRVVAPNVKAVWGLRAGTRLVLSHWWHRLPDGVRTRLTPVVRPIAQRFFGRMFEHF